MAGHCPPDCDCGARYINTAVVTKYRIHAAIRTSACAVALNDDDFSLPNLHVLPLIRALRGNLVLFLVYVYFDARIVTICSLQVNDRLDEILYLNGICNQLKDFLRVFVSVLLHVGHSGSIRRYPCHGR